MPWLTAIARYHGLVIVCFGLRAKVALIVTGSPLLNKPRQSMTL